MTDLGRTLLDGATNLWVSRTESAWRPSAGELVAIGVDPWGHHKAGLFVNRECEEALMGGRLGDLDALDATWEDAAGRMPFTRRADGSYERCAEYAGTYFTGARGPTGSREQRAASLWGRADDAVCECRAREALDEELQRAVATPAAATGNGGGIAALPALGSTPGRGAFNDYAPNLARANGPSAGQLALREFMERRRAGLKPARQPPAPVVTKPSTERRTPPLSAQAEIEPITEVVERVRRAVITSAERRGASDSWRDDPGPASFADSESVAEPLRTTPRTPVCLRVTTSPSVTPAVGRLRKGDAHYGHVCACGNTKQRQALRCKHCYETQGHRPVPTRPEGRAFTDATLTEARYAYDAGASMIAVAESLHIQLPGYHTLRSLTEALYSEFRSRGWPLRSRAEARRLSLTGHPAGDPALMTLEQLCVALTECPDVRLLNWVAKVVWENDIEGARGIFPDLEALHRALQRRFSTGKRQDRALAAHELAELVVEGLHRAA